MRHADAEPLDARYAGDDLRPLTRLGEDVQRKVAIGLKKMGVIPRHILTSPRLRTVQTAVITAEVLGLRDRVTQSHALGQGYSVEAVLQALAEFAPEDTVLCVGHEPDLRELSSAMLGMRGATIKLPRSGFIGIEFRDQVSRTQGQLKFFYRPQELLALL